ncbi:hypothetical protein [Pleionea sp. CnH1-48]|uniref:hypothetical protein n=1 Tax=Pleionea sp. CnH1-48 TaxID=2954494 RepID=UPI002097F41D|nr:hypothetical protein [Pleionea sp. CnH1-48]MCO7226169.1 hypothetical protein [Pleionea sp. CnH1-48]
MGKRKNRSRNKRTKKVKVLRWTFSRYFVLLLAALFYGLTLYCGFNGVSEGISVAWIVGGVTSLLISSYFLYLALYGKQKDVEDITSAVGDAGIDQGISSLLD